VSIFSSLGGDQFSPCALTLNKACVR
jgi:hypothetical protein